MKLSINPLESKSEVKRFKIPNKFGISHKGKRTNEISIVPPKLCPICEKTDVNVNYELRSRSYNFRKYITILMCSKHIQMKKKPIFSKLLYLIPLFIILLMVFIFITSILTTSITSLFIFLIIPIICVFITFIMIKDGNRLIMNQESINKYITLKSYQNYSILSIRRLDWANEFKNLNQASDYELDLELIQVYKKKRKQTIIHIGIIIVTCICGIALSSMLYNIGIITSLLILEIIFYIFFYLLTGAVSFFVIKIGYYTMKILDMEE